MPCVKNQYPKLFDIHSHLNFSAFKDDADEVIERTLREKVWTILVGSQSSTSERAVMYAEKYPFGIYAAVGLHPSYLEEGYFDTNEEFGVKEKIPLRKEEFDYDFYKKLAQNKKVVSIGESGLDYCHNPESARKKQIEVFEKHIELAIKLKKPLMVHCREAHPNSAFSGTSGGRAYQDAIKILEKFKKMAGDNLTGDIHFFCGAWEEAKKYFDLGFSISFTGVITFTSAYDEIIRKSPMDKIMVETDAPYVSPVPYRGKRNEPLYVAEVCRRIAEIKNISFEETARITTENALKLFKIRNVIERNISCISVARQSRK